MKGYFFSCLWDSNQEAGHSCPAEKDRQECLSSSQSGISEQVDRIFGTPKIG
jgi:hypothetical protein